MSQHHQLKKFFSTNNYGTICHSTQKTNKGSMWLKKPVWLPLSPGPFLGDREENRRSGAGSPGAGTESMKNVPLENSQINPKSIHFLLSYNLGSPGGASGKESACQHRRHKRRSFNPWVRKILWKRVWQPTSVFLPRESHGQRSPAGYSPWGHKELDTIEQLTLSLQRYKYNWFTLLYIWN